MVFCGYSLRPLLSVPVLPWLPWSQNWLLKQEIMWWRYIFWVFIVCTLDVHICMHLPCSEFTMKILAGHLRVLCFTKWSNRCCQSSNRQPYHSLMCDSSNKVFLNWKIYVFWITFLNCLLFGKTSHISLIYMPDLTTSVFRDISCVLFDRFMMLNF